MCQSSSAAGRRAAARRKTAAHWLKRGDRGRGLDPRDAQPARPPGSHAAPSRLDIGRRVAENRRTSEPRTPNLRTPEPQNPIYPPPSCRSLPTPVAPTSRRRSMRLYQGALDRFTADRNALAATLKKAGDKACRRAREGARKTQFDGVGGEPGVVAASDRFQAMLDAGAAQRKAHVAWAQGRQADVRAAGEARRAAVSEVTEAAPCRRSAGTRRSRRTCSIGLRAPWRRWPRAACRRVRRRAG